MDHLLHHRGHLHRRLSTATALSMRVRVRSFSEMRVSRSASSPMSETKSRRVSRSISSL